MKNTVFAFFAASRYWQNAEVLNQVYHELKAKLFAQSSYLIIDGKTTGDLSHSKGETLVIVPMSGAVQKHIIDLAGKFGKVIMYAAYIKGNAGSFAEAEMLKNNAAPTVMDCWGVLRQTKVGSLLALNEEQLQRKINVASAYNSIQGSKLLLIGETEPWVVSASRNIDDYARLGITIQKIKQQEVADLYLAIGKEESTKYYQKYKNGASAIVEPSDEDIANAGRMTAALVQIIEKYEASGIAIACFDLLKEGTTSCLGVSYINDCTNYVAACEGDLDSACTMLFMKKITKTKLWMANPGLHPDGIVNFSHCTAPINVDACSDCRYILRNHHESGIGASLQVELPIERKVTACRISASGKKITIQNGTSISGEYEPSCRTQLYVKFEDFDKYIKTALGCHQVFCFEDIKQQAEMLAELMNLNIE